MLLGVSLQITNGYATPFIDHFKDIPEYADTFGVNYPVVLYSISQISETCCILLIPFFMKRYGIKQVMLIAMFAWTLRFGFLGMGNPGMPGVLLFIMSMIVYGVAFDFFNISGSLFVDKTTSPEIRSSAQGLFMVMTNGLGATIGSLTAQFVVNSNTAADGSVAWTTVWATFSVYALLVGITFALIFRPKPEEIMV
jgi:NHS family nucleoside permease-like MFS transporter